TKRPFGFLETLFNFCEAIEGVSIIDNMSCSTLSASFKTKLSIQYVSSVPSMWRNIGEKLQRTNSLDILDSRLSE
ncbi:MAG: hypothetical protein ACFFFK_13105, partial [Candidatus Thorarchaeota archaeon]